MKRITSVFLSLCLMMALLVGCADTSSTVAPVQNDTSDVGAAADEVSELDPDSEAYKELVDGYDPDEDDISAERTDLEGDDLQGTVIDKDKNSKLVSYVRISPNKTVPRNHKIDTITIHCIGNLNTIEQFGELIATVKAQASSNYAVGTDGRIGMYVEEKDRSWSSHNATNDNRAINITVFSESTSPYKVSDKAYNATINLVADICKRNGIEKLVWINDKASRVSHKNGANMTLHRDYVAKACPGDYLYNRMGDIADKVNAELGVK